MPIPIPINRYKDSTLLHHYITIVVYTPFKNKHACNNKLYYNIIQICIYCEPSHTFFSQQ